jgi:hypothetical protein
MSAPANVGYRRDRNVRLNVEFCHFRAPFGGAGICPTEATAAAAGNVRFTAIRDIPRFLGRA